MQLIRRDFTVSFVLSHIPVNQIQQRSLATADILNLETKKSIVTSKRVSACRFRYKAAVYPLLHPLWEFTSSIRRLTNQSPVVGSGGEAGQSQAEAGGHVTSSDQWEGWVAKCCVGPGAICID